jgi:hypothetical protein
MAAANAPLAGGITAKRRIDHQPARSAPIASASLMVSCSLALPAQIATTSTHSPVPDWRLP